MRFLNLLFEQLLMVALPVALHENVHVHQVSLLARHVIAVQKKTKALKLDAVDHGFADLATLVQVSVRFVKGLVEVRMIVLVDLILTYSLLLHLELFVLVHEQRKEPCALNLILDACVLVIQLLLSHVLLVSTGTRVAITMLLCRIVSAIVGPLLLRWWVILLLLGCLLLLLIVNIGVASRLLNCRLLSRGSRRHLVR